VNYRGTSKKCLTREVLRNKRSVYIVLGDAMLYGHAAEVAIRAALYLAGRPPGELSPVHEVAKATKLPSAYLSKVIQRLAQAGLVRTFRGPGGGIELGKSPEAITLWSLVCATEGPSDVNRCALGIGNCSPDIPCPLHGRWAPLREDFQKLLEGTTLGALVHELDQAPGKEHFIHQRQARRTDTFSNSEVTRERQDRP
jgi:Rrf2 family protein